MSSELFQRHHAMLELVLVALATRTGFAAYPPNSVDYNEILEAEGKDAFANYRNSHFYLDQPGGGERLGEEVSPFAFALGIQYPKANLEAIFPAMSRAKEAWSRLDLETRAGICLEILHQLNTRSFEIALATMHTTGAPFDLAFRYGGPYAQERGLEALALAYQEMKSIPLRAIWREPEGVSVETIAKTFRVAGVGVGLVIGCASEPNWAAYPGLFADLMAGNAVTVKPHPMAVLPLAITVGVARRVLKDAGLPPDLITLVVDEVSQPLAQVLAARQEVRLIDFAGNSSFAHWLGENVRHARLRGLTGAVNPIVIDSTADPNGMYRNIAVSASLFAGRMSTSPRLVFTSSAGVGTPSGAVDRESFDEQLAQQFWRLLGDSPQASQLLGAIRPGEHEQQIADAIAAGDVVVESVVREHPDFPGAIFRTPLLVRIKPEQSEIYSREWFGPIIFLVECETIADAIARAATAARVAGAIVASIYSVDANVRAAAEDAFASTGAGLCINFTGETLMNHSASFSDFHCSGINQVAQVSLTDSEFVLGRFMIAASREQS